MFGRLAHLMYRRRWYVVGSWLILLVGAFMLASQIGSVLGPGNFTLPGSDSQKAANLLGKKFHQNDQKVTLVVLHSPHQTIKDPAFRQRVFSTAARIRGDKGLRVAALDNPLVSHNPQLIARDRHSVILMVSSNLKESDLEKQIDPLRAIVRASGLKTYVLGTAAGNHDYAIQSKNDLARGEMITVPILILILLLVFGAVTASLLPIILASCSIVLSLAGVFIFGHALDTSIYVTNVVTILGLGIGIDYSLFILYRFREELQLNGGHVEAAVVRTMETTGRAVFFSGMTVAIGLSSLILTKLTFMQSMGLGGMLVPFTALAIAMTLLPAVLGILGPKVSSLRIMPRRFLSTGERGPWHNLAMTIMRHPLIAGGAVLIIMLALAFPTTRLTFAFGSLKNGPTGLESVQGYVYMRSHFPTVSDPDEVVIHAQAPGTLLQPSRVAGMRALERQLKQNPTASEVVGPTNFLPLKGRPSARQKLLLSRYLSSDARTAVFSVIPRYESGTKQAETLVGQIRNQVSRFQSSQLRGNAIYVGGAQANFTDFNTAMYAKFPMIVVLILILSYCFLFFAFRSLFLPLKAVLLNLLSVGASFGLLVLVFQQGVGSSLLGFSAESGVASWVPIFLFAFLFGLSMDYEVFLLSRIRERWLATGNNAESVAFGLEKTGRLISSAAAIMVVAFTGFLLGHEIQLKEFGFGMLASIALDATLIRVILVPSIMELMGNWNWWVPSFLRGFASRGVARHPVPAPPMPTEERRPEPVTA